MGASDSDSGADIGQRIERLHLEAAAHFHGLDVSIDRFRGAVMAALEVGGAGIDELHTTDLYLALGCLDKQTRAIALLERDVFEPIRPSVERVCRDNKSDASVDDVMQWTREKLLVSSPPTLAKYTGRGSLVGWVRVVAVREALQILRKTKREGLSRARGAGGGDDDLLLDGSAPTSMELRLLREQYAGAFRSAVEQAIRRLTPEQRSLLRFHTRDGLTIDQLAPLLNVHRATAARRLEKARADALEHTRAILREAHGLSESEARSLCIALGSEVDISIGRVLEDRAAL